MRAIVDGDLTELLKMAVRMPDALQTTTESVSEEELSAIFEHISLAITDLQTFRIQEGKVLEKDFVLRISNIDSLLQELIFYLEKLDITEEKIRLKKHLDYFLETLHSEDSNGRKLSFIAQEIGREINTLGSKANFAPMQQLVVQMKDELEKIKEQVLNVL